MFLLDRALPIHCVCHHGMMFRMRISLLAWLATTAIPVFTAELQHIVEFGPNPTNASFYLYVPDRVETAAPLLVYPHWCHGTAQDAFDFKPWRTVADQLGFPVIYPSSPWTDDHCWDVSSHQTLYHDAGGDSLGIASMVRWTLDNYEAIDPDRVFVSGTSSGAMMTNVLIGAYPELFAAGSAFAGVPFGCFAGDGYAVWNDKCATGQIDRPGEDWASLVYQAFPEYSGPRPKMQVFHGSADEVLDVTNFYNEIKLWTTMLKTGDKPRVEEDNPDVGWTKSVYGEGDLFESFLALGVDHNIPDQVDEVVRFFDLGCVGPECFSRKSLPGCRRRKKST